MILRTHPIPGCIIVSENGERNVRDMSKDEIYELEVAMWEAAKGRDSKAFLNLVCEDAVMVCGGYRCTGKEYAEIISYFDCKSYSLHHFEVVNEDSGSIQVHYVLTLEVHDEKNMDLAGTFHITTTWRYIDETWKVVFNMDQRIIE